MYGKIFTQIYDGSLYGQWEALVTFQQLIVLANKDGEVDMTPEALSARTSIPIDILQRGLAELLAPDKRSRTPDEEGRRIVNLDDHRDWGWRITNYRVYAEIRTAEERREYFKQYKRKKRGEKKEPVHNVHHKSTDSTDAVAVVDTDTTTTTTTLANRFSDESHRTAYLQLRQASPSPVALDATLKSLADVSPAGAPVYGWPIVGAALHELVLANGAVRPTANQLRAFCRKLATAEVAPANGKSKLLTMLEAEYGPDAI